MIATDIREDDVLRLTPGGPACRVYRDHTRPKGPVERLVVDGVEMVRFVTRGGPVTIPAGQEVELVARHGDRRPVSLTKAWYLGPICVGAVVTYRHAPASRDGAAVFRVVDIVHGTRHLLAPYEGGDVAYTNARVGDLTLVRSLVVDAIRRRNRTEPQSALFEAGDVA